MLKEAQFMCLVVVSWPGKIFFNQAEITILLNIVFKKKTICWSPVMKEESPVCQLKNRLQQDQDRKQ